MNSRQSTTLALRIFGLYALVTALGGLSGWLWIWTRVDTPNYEFEALTLSMLAQSSAWGCAALVFLSSAGRIAARWTRADDVSESRAADPRPWQLVGFRIVGAYALVASTPNLASVLTGSVRDIHSFADFWRVIAIGSPYLFGSGLGLFLLLGARGLSNWIDRLRGVGLEPGEKAWKQS